jgi:thioesterase domain-containing protein
VAPSGRLHPLLHRETSSSAKTCYTSAFTGDELFLRDHRIFGQRILPGAAYVEMVRAALVLRAELPEAHALQLQDVAWVRPFVVGDEPAELHLRLARSPANDTLTFEFRADAEAGAAAAHGVYCRGRARAVRDGGLGRHDLEALRRCCTPAPVSVAQYYDRFGVLGIEYGPAHRGIAALDVAPDLVLARLELPEFLRGDADGYALHPTLLDAALQAAIAMPEETAAPPGGPAVPFWVREISISSQPDGIRWAVLRRSGGRETGDGGRARARPLDLDLCDAEGAVRVRLAGYIFKPLKGYERRAPQKHADTAATAPAAGQSAGGGRRLLTRLRAAEAVATAYCIPAGGMTPLAFVPLARAIDGLALSVLDQAPLFDAQPAPATVPETAAAFVQVLGAHAARAPYLLVGHSFGGSVAFELARQLEAAGQAVSLCMLDSPFYIPEERAALAGMSDHPGYFLGEPALVRVACENDGNETLLLERLTAAARVSIARQIGVSASANDAVVARIASLYARQIMLYRSYRPSGVLRGDVHVLLATDSILGGPNLAGTLQHYRKYMAGSIEVMTIAGGHLSLLRREHVGSLAAALRARADALFVAPAPRAPEDAPAGDCAGAARP